MKSVKNTRATARSKNVRGGGKRECGTEPADTLPYKIIDVNESNLDEHDLFCHKTKKRREGYQNKAKWIKERFKEGLRLRLLLIHEGKRGYRSRGFIEYVPGEYAWRGIDAKDYMVIHCIWVVGRNKRKGYGTKLLLECIKDAKGMKGVAVVTSNSGWLPKNRLFIRNGFEKVDELPPDFELYAKRFSDSAPPPRFNQVSKAKLSGITILHSHQCPYVPQAIRVVERIGKRASLPVEMRLITDCRSAQHNGVHPYGTYCVLLNGDVLTYRCSGGRDLVPLLKKKGMAD